MIKIRPKNILNLSKFLFSKKSNTNYTDLLSVKSSSGLLVDHLEFQSPSMFDKVKNYAKTNIALNQTETIFLDFKRKTFIDEVALPKYLSLEKSIQKKDKQKLQQDLSFPLYDVFKNCLKDKTKIPYILYNKDQIKNHQIVQGFIKLLKARIFQQNKDVALKSLIWHQITIQLAIQKDDQIINQILSIERRESDLLPASWRICYFD